MNSDYTFFWIESTTLTGLLVNHRGPITNHPRFVTCCRGRGALMQYLHPVATQLSGSP